MARTRKAAAAAAPAPQRTSRAKPPPEETTPAAKHPTIDLTVEEIAANFEADPDSVRALWIEERAFVREQKDAGITDTPTPIGDWFHNPDAAAKLERHRANGGNGSSRSGGTRRGGVKATYTRDGKPLSATHDSLSYMAYACTKGYSPDGTYGSDNVRIGVKEFKAILAKDFGIDDPEHSTWTVKLQNGITVGATMPGDQAAEKAESVKAEKKAEKPATQTRKRAPSKRAGTSTAAPKKASGTTKKASPKRGGPVPKSGTPQTGNRRARGAAKK